MYTKKYRKNASRTKRRNERTKARLRKGEYGKLFNGNIYAQGEFVFIWLLILAFILGTWLYMFSDTYKIKREDCRTVKLTVKEISREYGENGVKISFTVYENENEYTAFSWYGYNAYDTDIPVGGAVTLLMHREQVVGLTYNGTEVCTLKAQNAHRAEMRKVSYIMLVIAAVWIAYIAASWYIMYNAEKFPKLIKYFVKPEYINKNKIYKK